VSYRLIDDKEAIMADISKFPFVSHLRSGPTTYLRHAKNGRVRHEGVAQSFWFQPLSAALSEVPVDDRDLPLIFHARTADFQDVVVSATVTYRVSEPGRAAERIDFGIDPRQGLWSAAPLEQLGSLLTELAQQHALELLARMELAEALVTAPPILRERIEAGLAGDERLSVMGIAAVAVRVGPVRPEADLERALGTPARELVQQDADRATFERRALAVESERAIAENELRNQIGLATREQELIVQRGRNEQRRVEDAAAASRVDAAAEADRLRVVGEAEAAAERARLDAYADVQPPILLGLALKELATNLPEIEHLTLTPDLVTEALARVAGTR
jgi:regulator of protease activity HflC (stomatin/prohibitin superfamily)